MENNKVKVARITFTNKNGDEVGMMGRARDFEKFSTYDTWAASYANSFSDKFLKDRKPELSSTVNAAYSLTPRMRGAMPLDFYKKLVKDKSMYHFFRYANDIGHPLHVNITDVDTSDIHYNDGTEMVIDNWDDYYEKNNPVYKMRGKNNGK